MNKNFFAVIIPAILVWLAFPWATHPAKYSAFYMLFIALCEVAIFFRAYSKNDRGVMTYTLLGSALGLVPYILYFGCTVHSGYEAWFRLAPVYATAYGILGLLVWGGCFRSLGSAAGTGMMLTITMVTVSGLTIASPGAVMFAPWYAYAAFGAVAAAIIHWGQHYRQDDPFMDALVLGPSLAVALLCALVLCLVVLDTLLRGFGPYFRWVFS